MGREGDPEQLVALSAATLARWRRRSPTTRSTRFVSLTPGCTDDLVHLNHCGSSLPAADRSRHPDRTPPTRGDDRRLRSRRARRPSAEAAVYDVDRRDDRRRAARDRSDGARHRGLECGVLVDSDAAPANGSSPTTTTTERTGSRFLRAVERTAVSRSTGSRATPTVRSTSSGSRRRSARPDDVALVSLAWIPTSGGLVNPAAAVGALARAADVPFLLDACQAVGQLEIDVASDRMRLPHRHRTQVPARPTRDRVPLRA